MACSYFDEFVTSRAVKAHRPAELTIFTVTTLLGALTFPAASVTVWAVEEIAVPTPLRIWSGGHAPGGIPEPPSLQVKWTTTLPEYQPLTFGAVVAAALIVGAVWSTLNDVLTTLPRLLSRSSLAA